MRHFFYIIGYCVLSKYRGKYKNEFRWSGQMAYLSENECFLRVRDQTAALNSIKVTSMDWLEPAGSAFMRNQRL